MSNPHAKWTPPPSSIPSLAPDQRAKKPRRWFLIFFLVVQAIFLVFLVTGIASVSGGPEDCTYLTETECNDAHAAGATIGIGIIIAIWAAVDIILGVTYGIYRLVKGK